MTKSKCGIREEQVKGKEKALFCELCEQWRHTSCDKVEEETYAALNEGNDKRLYWFCADCNLKAMKGIKVVICLEKRTMEIEAKMSKMEANIEKTIGLKDEIKELQSSFDQFKEEIDNKVEQSNSNGEEKNLSEVKDSLKDEILLAVEERVEKVEKEKVTAKEGWTTVVAKAVSKAIKEKTDVNKRINNIILHRIEETANVEESKKNDEEIIKALLSLCEVEGNISSVNEFKRLGKKAEGKIRPILVSFRNKEQKDQLFKNLKKLKDAPDNLSVISVNHDLNQEQREVTKNLWTEAKRKQEEDPLHRYRVRGPIGEQKIVKLSI